MKILVFADRLDLGGSQVNAIELTAMLRDSYGHEVVIFAPPGPMAKLVADKGIRYVEAPDRPTKVFPSLSRMRAFSDVVAQEKPDLIHVWDWPQCLDAYYGVYLRKQIPMVVSSMTMSVDRLLPKSLPTTFGTPAILDEARAAGRISLELILPPVDTTQNAPNAADPKQFKAQYGIDDNQTTLISISRLVEWMKAEGLRRIIDVVQTLDNDLPLKFVIVGEGPSYHQLKQLADKTNDNLGRPAVVLTGGLLDPRPAYAAADIVVGMGGSGLRGMAFGKPVLVIGEQGFSKPFTPETADYFYYNGIYGIGDGDNGNEQLISHIRSLAQAPDQLPELGKFAREFVMQHFSLEAVCARLNKFLENSLAGLSPSHTAVIDGIRTGAVVLGQELVPYNMRQLIKRLLLQN